VKREGYWRKYKEENSDLPWPALDPAWKARAEFLVRLEKAEAVAERVAYRGISLCRLCGCRNGHEALHLGDWDWPAGYKHYIVEHQVRPTADFEAFILGLRLS
jgi:hypothetical protein